MTTPRHRPPTPSSPRQMVKELLIVSIQINTQKIMFLFTKLKKDFKKFWINFNATIITLKSKELIKNIFQFSARTIK